MTNGIDAMCNYLMSELASEFSSVIRCTLVGITDTLRSADHRQHVFKDLPVSDREAAGVKYFTFSPGE